VWYFFPEFQKTLVKGVKSGQYLIPSSQLSKCFSFFVEGLPSCTFYQRPNKVLLLQRVPHFDNILAIKLYLAGLTNTLRVYILLLSGGEMSHLLAGVTARQLLEGNTAEV